MAGEDLFVFAEQPREHPEQPREHPLKMTPTEDDGD
jgi:hypothetical protein